MNKVLLLPYIVILCASAVAFPMNRGDADSLHEPVFNEHNIEKPLLSPANFEKFLPDRIIINQHTGQIIAGSSLPVRELEIEYREIHIRICAEPVSDDSESGSRFDWGETTTVGQIVSTLLNLAVQPAEIIDILRIFKQEGALRAELEIW